jgi:hypothetical protein
LFGKRIKIDSELLKKAKECAAREGYSSVGEFIEHVLEKEIARLSTPQSGDPEEEVKKRLQGLGYIE